MCFSKFEKFLATISLNTFTVSLSLLLWDSEDVTVSSFLIVSQVPETVISLVSFLSECYWSVLEFTGSISIISTLLSSPSSEVFYLSFSGLLCFSVP